jgi:hypothetical protein
VTAELDLPSIVRGTERNDVRIPARRFAPQLRIGHRSVHAPAIIMR